MLFSLLVHTKEKYVVHKYTFFCRSWYFLYWSLNINLIKALKSLFIIMSSKIWCTDKMEHFQTMCKGQMSFLHSWLFVIMRKELFSFSFIYKSKQGLVYDIKLNTSFIRRKFLIIEEFDIVGFQLTVRW